MRRVLLLLALACLAAAPAHRAVPAPSFTLAPDSEQRWVSFTLTPGNQIALTATLDDQPVNAVLDTGVSFSVLGRAFVDRARLPVEPGGNATVIGGSVPIGWVATHQLSLGGLTRTGGRLTVAKLPALATGGAARIDLLIGRDLIGGCALEIDYAAKRLRLLPSGRMPFTGYTAPLAIGADPQVYVTELTLGSERLRPMIVDTGDGSSITVASAAWRSAGMTALPTTSVVAYGLAGPVVSTLAIVPALAIGQLVAQHTEVRIEPPGGFSDTIGARGRVGSGFLQNYHVLLDPRAGHMLLAPGPRADQLPLKSTSGILVGIEPGKLLVIHVMANGPAAAAGWRAGETICSVEGQPIPADYAHSRLASWSVGAPGSVVTLGLCDGTQRKLTLANFY